MKYQFTEEHTLSDECSVVLKNKAAMLKQRELELLKKENKLLERENQLLKLQQSAVNIEGYRVISAHGDDPSEPDSSGDEDDLSGDEPEDQYRLDEFGSGGSTAAENPNDVDDIYNGQSNSNKSNLRTLDFGGLGKMASGFMEGIGKMIVPGMAARKERVGIQK